MSEELEQTEETTEAPQKVKKGFSLSPGTVAALAAKVEETGHRQSAIVDSVLDFGIPAFGENGMGDYRLITKIELQEIKAAVSESVSAVTDWEPLVNAIRESEGPTIPVPEPAPTKRGRREKLRVPGMNQVPQQVVDIEQQQKELYRPNIGQPVPEPGTTHTPMAGEQGTGVIEANMAFLMQQMAAMQTMMQQQMGQQPAPTQAPVDMNPYNQTQQQPTPQPAPQFAASYPPGYTGPPGVAPVAPQPQQPQQAQGMYPMPGNTPRQPQHLQDPYAMNIGQPPGGNPGALTAQGLLSGSQGMNPNVAGQNVNMDIASRALGPNWRNNLHRMTAANSREG